MKISSLFKCENSLNFDILSINLNWCFLYLSQMFSRTFVWTAAILYCGTTALFLFTDWTKHANFSWYPNIKLKLNYTSNWNFYNSACCVVGVQIKSPAFYEAWLKVPIAAAIIFRNYQVLNVFLYRIFPAEVVE